MCWWLEFHTRDIGSISGGSSKKHLIWWSTANNTWKFPDRFDSVEDAWEKIRSGFAEMFEHVADDDFTALEEPGALEGAAALRTKALYMYFPDKFIPVSSKTHLRHFIQALGQEPTEQAAPLLNRQLFAQLRQIDELEDLSSQELGYFLYHWADPRTAVRIVRITPG